MREENRKGTAGDYTFGKVEVDLKTADHKFEVIKGAKKKKKKKKKASTVVSPTPPLKPKPDLLVETKFGDGKDDARKGKSDEKNAFMQSPLVARIK